MTVFILLGIILWLVSMPIQAALVAVSAPSVGWLDLFGGVLWSIALLFEAVGHFSGVALSS